jgi:hypothetical protein
MGVPRQAPAATTGGRVFELKAKGEEKSEATLDKRLAIVKQTKIGHFVVKINGDGPVFTGLAGGGSHGSPSRWMT